MVLYCIIVLYLVHNWYSMNNNDINSINNNNNIYINIYIYIYRYIYIDITFSKILELTYDLKNY